ncbi:hypothetical protein ACN08X_04495 [Rothia sp. P6271]|uniref:hypothetical protein n=1 Tax=unclassified Rothia (in: high G+C Gram-positive bacteria) TaxID=2689056 RepID=UPI003AC6DEEE
MLNAFRCEVDWNYGCPAPTAGFLPVSDYLLATQNWYEVAWALAWLVDVNVLEGGLVGIVTYLVAAGVWCATPWVI